MYKCLLALFVFHFYACGTDTATSAADSKDTVQSSQTIHTNVTDTVVTNAKPLVLNGCYQMILRRDTATLNLTVKDTTVTGDLRYDWYEKDGNAGTLKGVLRNDLIYADYTFQSEGRTSVREVVFKIQDGTLVEGFGDVTDRSGKIVFVNKSALQFQTGNPFLKTVCP